VAGAAIRISIACRDGLIACGGGGLGQDRIDEVRVEPHQRHERLWISRLERGHPTLKVFRELAVWVLDLRVRLRRLDILVQGSIVFLSSHGASPPSRVPEKSG
jgi:hypothetical protein